jgi:YidC/Oxa1 family membrane protein insertase
MEPGRLRPGPLRNENNPLTRPKSLLVRLAPLLLIVGVALLVAACGLAPGGAGGSPTPTPIPSQLPLRPASLGPNPIDLLAWLFTPIFQVFFIGLVLIDQVTHSIILSIILLTIVIKILMTPITRRQLVSSRQTQLLAPEVKELQRKYKGDRVKQQAAVSEFYKQRGINPASGCLPSLLQLGLLIPMYSVFNQGLTNYDVNQMLNVFGFQLFKLSCDAAPSFSPAGHVINACLKPEALGINWSLAEPITTGLFIAGFGVSILAILSSLVQLVASRMMIPPVDPKTTDDPNVKVQRQMAYFLPLISILYGGFLPAGLFLYWITSTVIQIIQQYLILGWAGMFPLFGWYPEFARNHTPRYPVPIPAPKPPAPGQPTTAAERAKAVDRSLSAQGTIRRNKARTARRGRRR